MTVAGRQPGPNRTWIEYRPIDADDDGAIRECVLSIVRTVANASRRYALEEVQRMALEALADELDVDLEAEDAADKQRRRGSGFGM